MEIICYFAGTLFYYTKSMYACMCLLTLLFFNPRIKCIFIFTLSIIAAAIHHTNWQKYNLDPSQDNQTLVFQGKVTSFPSIKTNKTQFQFTTTNNILLLLSCYKNCTEIKPNQSLRVTVKLRKSRNFANPGGFNYVSFLETKHIKWLGTVKKLEVLPQKQPTNIRNKLNQNIESLSINTKAKAILQALTLGISNNIEADDWNLFRNTGTIHLLVISGAHIGFVSGLFFLLIKSIWTRIPRANLFIPSQVIASIMAILIACIYSWLAGFSVSVQRAVIACVFVLSRNFIQIKFNNWQAWRTALLCVIILEPHAVLIPGFYLSFIAVSIIFIVSKYFCYKKIKSTILIQLSCLIGLLPFTLYWYGNGSINSFFANLVAIPLVGFIIVPVSLLTLVFAIYSNCYYLAILLNTLINFLYGYLNFIDKYIDINFTQKISIYTALIYVFIILLNFIYPLKSLRIPLASLITILFLPHNHKIKINDAKIDILDVGQGLAIVVQTAKHTLIYDTGGKFYQGPDLGEMVIAPYLKLLKIKRVDKIIISHPDLDHRGGLKTIEKNFKVQELIVNNPSFYQKGKKCHEYKAWNWDGVTFEFLEIAKNLRSKNNDSCVLKIKNPQTSILLTGDIEYLAEKYLLATNQTKLQANYLVVPHHGSKTSSSSTFIKNVNPDYAIFSYGHNNRYKFPHEEVIKRYTAHNIKLLNTDECGMITIHLKNPPPKCFSML